MPYLRKAKQQLFFVSIMLVKKCQNLLQNLSAFQFWSPIPGRGWRGPYQTIYPNWNGNQHSLQVALGLFFFLKQRLGDQ